MILLYPFSTIINNFKTSATFFWEIRICFMISSYSYGHWWFRWLRHRLCVEENELIPIPTHHSFSIPLSRLNSLCLPFSLYPNDEFTVTWPSEFHRCSLRFAHSLVTLWLSELSSSLAWGERVCEMKRVQGMSLAVSHTGKWQEGGSAIGRRPWKGGKAEDIWKANWSDLRNEARTTHIIYILGIQILQY